ncbi:MAG: division/cell wall cluster transcriptional repressor MraZ [Mycoplasmatota bacterium]
MFLGEYHHFMDLKGRITLPSKLRNLLGEEFIITRGLDNCLFIYSKEEFSKLIDKYKQLPNTYDARNFMRFFLSGALELTFDKQGRINISTPLIKYADLKKEVVIIGVNDHLEVFDKTKWEEFIKKNEENITEVTDKLFESYR